MRKITGSIAQGRATDEARERLVGLILQEFEKKRYRKAVELARKAVALAPEDAFVRKLCGMALSAVSNHERAIAELGRAASLAPADAGIRFCLAASLHRAGRMELAMVEYRACLDGEPDHRDALWNYGELLRLREHFAAALECFEYLLMLEGKTRPAMAHRMAVCCSHLGMEQRADALFERQLREEPSVLTQWEYSHHLLQSGRSEDAWPYYARRFEAGAQIDLRRATYRLPFWVGEFRSAAALLVQGEQGAGDEMLFAAFYPELLRLAKSVGMRVILACRPNLVRLFQASFPDALVIARARLDGVVNRQDLGSAIEGCDPVWTVMQGDLPLWIRRPVPLGYLEAAADDRQVMKALLGPARRLRIGLAWASSPELVSRNRQQRNVPVGLIANLVASLDSGGHPAEFFSLHTGEHRQDLASLSEVCVRDMSRHLTDFSRTAALIQELDVVISVCTSVANLAGALGSDTRVLLQKYANWRWNDRSPWYARVQAYRQREQHGWGEPLSRLHHDCLELLNHRNLGDGKRMAFPKQR